MRLRPSVAVAVAKAGSCNPDSTPNLGTYICHGCGHPPTPPPKKKSDRESDAPNSSFQLSGPKKLGSVIMAAATSALLPVADRAKGKGKVNENQRGNKYCQRKRHG